LNYNNFKVDKDITPKEYVKIEIENGMSFKDIEKVLIDSSVIKIQNFLNFL